MCEILTKKHSDYKTIKTASTMFVQSDRHNPN